MSSPQFCPDSGLRMYFSSPRTHLVAFLVLSPEEQSAFKYCFTLADEDKDGIINTKEAVAFLRKSHIKDMELAAVCSQTIWTCSD